MRKSFTWFLSFLVLLVALSNRGYSQEAQETVELYAQTATDCYKQADDYTVDVSVRDFILLTRFDLDLDYNSAIFTYAGASNVISSLSTMTVTESPAGKLNFVWTGTPTTIGDNAQTAIVKLHFKVKGFPDNAATAFTSNLTWSVANFWYTTSVPAEDAVNTVVKTNGSLAVNVNLTDVTTAITPETCAGGNTTVTVTAPGATSYLFNEDPTVSNWVWTSSNTYTAPAGSIVTVRVKNASGCMSLMKTVNIPSTVNPVAFTATKQDPTCYGGLGSIVVNATGGTAPYKYYVNSVASSTGATVYNNFQFAMAPGTYYVAAQDANGCANLGNAAYWQTLTITDNNLPVAIASNFAAIACNGGKTNVTFSITEGTTAIGKTSQVSIDNGLTWGTVGDTVAENLVAGTYKIKVKTATGCIITGSNVVLTQPAALAFTIKIKDVSCGGDQDGIIYVSNITGGTAPYKLTIVENGNQTDSLNVPAAGDSLKSLKPTYYSLTVTDANGCVKEYSNPNGSGNVIAVQSPKDIQYTVSVTDPLCNNGDAKITVSNITGGKSAYAIFFNGIRTTNGGTTYTWPSPYADVIVTVANADSTCGVSITQTADEDMNPDVLTASVDAVFAPTCIDGNDGNIHLNIQGGTMPYYYSINNSTWKEVNSHLAIIKVSVGTHTIVVKDKNGCENTTEIDPVEVTLQENIIDATAGPVINCYGDKEGTISVAVNSWAQGGAPLRTVKFWVKNAAGATSGFDPAEDTFNAGTYIVWATDQYTCESNKDTVVITQNPELKIVSVNSNGASCYQSYDGIITITAEGGTVDGVLEYAIANTEAAIDNIGDDKWLPFTTYDEETTISTVSFNVDGGTYWIRVKDDGCADLKRGPITVEGYKQLLVDESKITLVDPLCNGDENGSITVPMTAVTGGAGAYKFTLLDGEGDPIEDYTELSTGDFNNLPAGWYSVLVEDSKGCPSYTTDQVELVEPEVLSFMTDTLHMSCYNSNDGQIKVTATGGTMDYWYAINNTNTWFKFEDESSTQIYIATEAGTYTVWVKDANGCMAGPDVVTIKKPTQLSADVVTTKTFCYGSNDGTATVTGKGGWQGMTLYSYKVDNGSWTTGTTGAWTFTGLVGGTHKAYIKDVNAYSAPYQPLSCIDSVYFNVDQPAPIVYDVVVTDVKCKGGNDGSFTVTILSGGTPWDLSGTVNDGFDVRLTGNAYDSGVKRTGADNSYTFTGLAHSHYTVYITDSKGCVLPASIGDKTAPYSTEESWEIAEPATSLTLIPEWKNDVTCYNGNDGQFVLNATGGVAPYKYYAGYSDPSVNGGHVLVPAPASNLWQESNTFLVKAGTWITWVMDANGCIVGGEEWNGVPVNTWRVQIEQPAQVVWNFHTMDGKVHYVAPKCNGDANGEIHLVGVAGGNGAPYSAHVWGLKANGGTFDKTYDNILAVGGIYKLTTVPAGHFNVTVFDKKNCTSKIDTITIKQPEVLAVTLAKGDNQFTCANSTEGIIVATATGGTKPYSYQLLKNGLVHTPWQSVSNAFLVQIGNTYIVQVKDANNCMTEDTITIDPVQPVVIAAIDNISCYGEPKASARVTVTGEPGRTFQVSYKNIEANGAWVTDTTKFTGHLDLIQKLIYDSENLTDVHYAFKVKDNKGCESVIDTMTFDTVQHPLAIVVEEVSVNECKAVVKVSANGGVAPYVLTLDGEPISAGEVTVSADVATTFNFAVTDAHLRCIDEASYEFTPVLVVKDTAVTTYYGEKTQFVYAEADLDTMLAVGEYTFVYDYEGCPRTLNVTVTETCKPVVVAAKVVKEMECSGDVEITVTGIETYDLYVDNVKVTSLSQTLNIGTHEVKVVYSGGKCTEKTSVTVVGAPVNRTDEETTYKGEKVHYVDAEAKVDEWLGAGVYTYTYLYNTCTRTLTVTVTEVWRTPKIAEVQGTGDASPLVDKMVEITGTVSGVAAGEGFFVQDANAAWGGIWVEYSATTTQGIQIGNGVKVHGTVTEVSNVTTVLATDFTFIPPVLALEPLKLDPSVIEAEKYESVLVKVAGGRATAQDASTKEWKIYYATTDDVIVNDWMYSYPAIVKDHYYDVIGVVNAKMDNYKVEPRVSGDVKDLTLLTSTKPELGVEFKVYPNPFNDHITIDNNDKLSRIVVVNVAGQRVIDVEYPEREIRTAHLVSGVYVISLYTESGLVKTDRLIKR